MVQNVPGHCFGIGKGNPDSIRVATKPRELPFGIVSCVLLNQFNGRLAIGFAIEEIEPFRVPNGIQGLQVTIGENAPCFFFQALCHHDFHAVVDALIELFPGMLNDKIANVERVFFDVSFAQGGVGFTGKAQYFYGPDDSDGVLTIHGSIIVGILFFYFRQQWG